MNESTLKSPTVESPPTGPDDAAQMAQASESVESAESIEQIDALLADQADQEIARQGQAAAVDTQAQVPDAAEEPEAITAQAVAIAAQPQPPSASSIAMQPKPEPAPEPDAQASIHTQAQAFAPLQAVEAEPAALEDAADQPSIPPQAMAASATAAAPVTPNSSPLAASEQADAESAAAPETEVQASTQTQVEAQPQAQPQAGNHSTGSRLSPTNLFYRTLAAINTPLRQLSAENRNLVGYAGMLTLFNALCLLTYGLIQRL